MATSSRQPAQGQNGTLSTLNEAIQDLNLARNATSPTPAKAVCGSVSALLTTIRDTMINRFDYVELGLACASVCGALNPEVNGGEVDAPGRPVSEAIEQLTTAVVEIQRDVVKQGKRNAISRFFRAKKDKRRVAAWRLELDRILRVLNTGPMVDGPAFGARNDATDTRPVVPNSRHNASGAHPIVLDDHRESDTGLKVKNDGLHADTTMCHIHRDVSTGRGGREGKDRAAYASAPAESPPPQLGNAQEIGPDIRRAVMKNSAVVSEIQRDVSDTNALVSDIHRNMRKKAEGADGQDLLAKTSASGELPPPPPRVCFGREELIERIVCSAETLTPIALIGVGGIGKTSIALTALHNDRLKQHFGNNRYFIRCDKFPVSLPHLLHRLSEVTGAGIKNPESLTPLHPFLSSRRMLIVLDNAESILDPRVTNAQEIYDAVEELSHFGNICLCITSRISTVPPGCKTIEVPTLSMEPAQNTFYCIYQHGGQSELVDTILKQLDFHPLSITLLATVAHQNKWDVGRLRREWEQQRTEVLQTVHNKSLAATIELSLTSPMFQELGHDARELLGIIAFFPQGVNENNIKWLLPTIPNCAAIFDRFCILSLTYRSNGFVTMLAPLRDYLSPKNPMLSPLLERAKKCYFDRLAIDFFPGKPGYEEVGWIKSEDINVEHLLNIFTSIDTNSVNVWDTCAHFIRHIYWEKQRLTILGPKIKRLPDNHPSKPKCFFWLGRLSHGAGNFEEEKQLLSHALQLWKEWKDDFWVAETLRVRADANRLLGFYNEGIEGAEEALKIYEQLNNISGQALSLRQLGWLWNADKQLEKAEEAVTQALNLFLGADEKFEVCITYRILGEVCESRGDIERAIKYFEAGIEAGFVGKWIGQMYRGHYHLAALFLSQGKLDDAHGHLQQAKANIVDDEYHLARVVHLEARVQYQGSQLSQAKSNALFAADTFEMLGATIELNACKELLQQIQDKMNELGDSGV